MSEQGTGLVELVVESEVLTQVTVLDQFFQLVGSGSAPLRLKLAPGPYLVQFKLGATVNEVPTVLRAERPVTTVRAPAQQIASPAPLGGTPAAFHYKQFASQCSRRIDLDRGAGGELMLFLRAAMSDQTEASLDRLLHVTVLTDTLDLVVDLRERAHRAADGFSGGYNLQLAPGCYLLRYDAGDLGPLEQTVFVSEDWQTQVFASSRRYPSGEAGVLGPNLADAAIFMAPIGDGFDPEQPAFVSAESARQALAEDRALVPEARLREVGQLVSAMRANVPSEPELRRMLRQKFTNPMLGLYGAHLMLLQPLRDRALVTEVFTNLRTILGDHPDVMALGALPEIEVDPPTGIYNVPPMLRSSWTLLVAESVKRPELMPADSYSAAIAGRITGCGSWLTWKAAPDAALAREKPRAIEDAAAVSAALVQVLQFVVSGIRSTGATAFIAGIARDKRFTQVERALLLYVGSAVGQGTAIQNIVESAEGIRGWLAVKLRERLSPSTWATLLLGAAVLSPILTRELTSERIARAISIPFASVGAALVSLSRKLTERAASGNSEAP